MTVNSNKSNKRKRKRAPSAEMDVQMADALQHITATRQMVAEVVEDNMALLEAVKRSTEGQEGVRAVVVRETDRLREQVSGEMQFLIAKNTCREIIPILHTLKRMAAGDDFTNADAMRQHVESLASTLDGALRRLGINRIEVKEGMDLFDAGFHECVKVCDREDSPMPDAPHRAIVRVEEAGYTINGRLAVPARVWVQRIEEETTYQEKGAVL